MNKLLIALLLSSISFTAFSATATKNIQVSATVLPYCKLGQKTVNNKVVAVQECFGNNQYPVSIKEESIDGIKVTSITY